MPTAKKNFKMKRFRTLRCMWVHLILITSCACPSTKHRLKSSSEVYGNAILSPGVVRSLNHSRITGLANLEQLNNSSGQYDENKPTCEPSGPWLQKEDRQAKETSFQNTKETDWDISTLETSRIFSGEFSRISGTTDIPGLAFLSLNKSKGAGTPVSEEGKYSNRTDHCAYYFSDKSCPWPTHEVMHKIDIICEALKIQVHIIFSLALAFGIPGSVLVVVTVTSITINPSTVYMAVLSISNSIALITGVQIFKMPNVGKFTIDDMIPMWLCRLFQTFSQWTLALICAERFVSVAFPLKKSQLYTMRTTAVSAGAAFLISVVPFVWSCVHYSVYHYPGNMVLHLNIIHNLVYILVPGAIIIIFSTATAIKLKQIAKKRKRMMTTSNLNQSSKLDAVLTRMMFVEASCFVLINAPWVAIHIYNNVRILFCPFTEAVFNFFYYGLLSFTFVNHAINFYVYYALSKGFRRQFCRLIRTRLDRNTKN